jgi:hypothetical protein
VTDTGTSGDTSSGIGTLNEGSLHAGLKQLVSEPGDRFEVPLDGYVIDVVRGEALIEIQTGSFAALGKKFDHLLGTYKIRLVHPIAVETWLHRPDGKVRKSPVRKSIYDILEQLVSLPTLLDHPNFTLEVVLIGEDRITAHDPKKRRGRGGWGTVDRRIRDVRERVVFESSEDLWQLVPPDLPEEFTTADLAREADINRGWAQRLAYCMRATGQFIELQRTRSGIHYRLRDE